MLKWIIPLLFIAQLASSQVTTVKFTVIDSLTNEPLSFAPITDLDRNFLGYTAENGEFISNITEKTGGYSICFLSYACKTLTVEELKTGNGIVYLLQQPIVLATVTVTPSQKTRGEVGYHNAKTDFRWGSGSGLIFANYFINKYPKTPYLSKVFVGMNNSLKEKKNTLVRLRLYKSKPDNSPGEDLANVNLLYVVKRIQKKLEFDVDSLNIKIPEEGIVVGIEIIGFYKGNELIVSQRGTYTIGICSTKDPNREMVGSAWRYFHFEKGWFSVNSGLGKDTMFKIGIEISD